METIVNLLRSKGYKITPQRRAVIDALKHCGKFSTAQNILDFVKKSHPNVSLDTVYRNLNMLAEIGFVHEINTKNRDGNVFEIAGKEHHHHFVCTECGRLECMEACPVNEEIIGLALERGFEITGHLFELYGRCSSCRQNNRG